MFSVGRNFKPMDKSKRIKEFWEEQAVKRGLSIQTGSFDFYLKLLEVDEILNWFSKQNGKILKVLDVGCGTGYTICRLANFGNLDLYGVDYSQKIIDLAQRRRSRLGKANSGRVKFLVGDACSLPFEDESFDVVITERALINLADIRQQKKAIKGIWRILKEGGVCLSFEGYKQGFEAINQLRVKFGLEEIKETWSTSKLDKAIFFPFFKKYFIPKKEKDFGLYYFISRVIYPLLIQPRQPKYRAKMNRVAYKVSRQLDYLNDIGHLKFLELQKLDEG